MTGARQVQFWFAGFIVFCLLVFFLRDILTPFVAGMAVAYFVDPLADRLERAGLSRTLATSVITLLFFILAFGILAAIVPVLTTQILGFAGRIPFYFESLRSLVEPYLLSFFEGLDEEEIKQLGANAAGFAKQGLSVVGDLFKRLLSGGLFLVDVISLLVLTPLVTFYLLRDWDVMVAKIDSWLPRKQAPIIREQVTLIDKTMAGFVRGQASVCLILGVFYAIGLTVLGLEFGLLVGLGAGLISFIPYFGSILGFVVSIGIAIVQFGDPVQIGLVAGVFLIGQVLEGNFLTPKLVGGQVGLHPVWIIFALMAGGTLAGFAGVIVAVPVAAVIGVLVRFGLSQYLNSRLYSDPPTEDQDPDKQT